jgi:uncharacterized membrane protein YfcA
MLAAGPCSIKSDLLEAAPAPVQSLLQAIFSTHMHEALRQNQEGGDPVLSEVEFKSRAPQDGGGRMLPEENNGDNNDNQNHNDNGDNTIDQDKKEIDAEDDDFFRDEYHGSTTGNTRGSQDDDFYKFVGDPLPPRLFPLNQRDVIGFMLASLAVTLGASGGIGGGGLVVPCYIIAMGLPPRIAIPLGSVTVFGGSLAAVMFNFRRRHPLADRPIIDFDLILVMEPLVLVGALFGAILHRVVSEKILMVLLVLLLSVSAHTTLSKAKRMYNAEQRYIEHLKAARSDDISRMCSFQSAFRGSDWSALAVPGEENAEMKSLSGASPERGDPISPNRIQSMDSKSISANTSRLAEEERQRILILNPDFVTLRSDLIEQEKVTPKNKIIALLGKFSVLIFLNITLGGGAFQSPWGIQCGSVAFWVVHVIMVAFLVSSAWAAQVSCLKTVAFFSSFLVPHFDGSTMFLNIQTYLVNRHEIKEIVRFDYVHGDIKWEPRNAVIYPSFFMGAGLCAGMFGIGGGMITVPLLLSMGMHPAVVSATASSMVFFTAALSTSSFALFDLILWDYAVVCVCVGFVGSLIGQGIMKRARQSAASGTNFERNSFIAYCIGCVIMLSALLMTMQYILEIVRYDQDASASKEGGLCEGYRYVN